MPSLPWPHPAFSHPGFAPFRPFLSRFSLFPDHADWAACAAPCQLDSGIPVRFVAPELISDYYETAITRDGTVATRADNWHDAFNALIWHHFPHSKLAFNALHQREITRSSNPAQRGPVRDAATLLDECGLLITSSDPALLDALAAHDWQALFAAEHWSVRLGACVIGHATLESLLNPFIGLTGKCVPVLVPPEYFNQDSQHQLAALDRTLATAISAGWLQSPRQLPVLPWLGIPGWWPEQDAAFYADTTHFCPQPPRQRHSHTTRAQNALTLVIA
ncbi:DUF3025 domain-containing protein [Chitinilyticum aquatile]|uniref:DUF3025 domain-containing protein n=1 Tax=Chitinilyticum aquatile TaxID=362520 RepID=UPI0004042FD8|nr:DUF3025 domain-containing protein [Chitinilyticum aquatile]